MEVPSLKIFGAETVKVGETTYDIHGMLAERKQILKEDEYITEAKLQISIRGKRDPKTYERKKINQKHVLEYLSRYADHMVKSVEFEGWLANWSLPSEEMAIATAWGNYTCKLEKRISYLKDYLQDKIKKEPKTFGEVLKTFTGITLDKERTVLDNVRHMILIKETLEGAKTPTGRHTHVVDLGCQGDCNPMLHFTTENKDYEEFIEFFSKKGYDVQVNLCTRILKPKMKDKWYKIREEGFETVDECGL